MVGNDRSWNQVRILIAGCGSIGRRHARIMRELGVAEVSICDPSDEQRALVARECAPARSHASFAHALADHPDAVVVCTPPALHLSMISQAMAAGCHVLCEKPLSDRTSGIDAVVTLSQQARKTVMVGLCSRFHAGHLLARQLLDQGRIGRLVSIRALMGEPLPEIRTDYRQMYLAKEVGAFELMHEIDLAIWYARQDIRSVQSASGAMSDIGIQAPDLAEILLEFSGRCVASIHLDFFQHPRRRQLELMGTTGTILIEWAQWERCTVSLYEAGTRAWRHHELATARDDMFRAEDQEFLQAIREGRPSACGLDEARRSVAVVEAALQQGKASAAAC